MTADGDRLAELRQGRPRHRPDWQRAVRAMRELVRHPDRTELAFEVTQAIDGDRSKRTLLRMLEQAEGRHLYEVRPSLREALAPERLAALPPGSFGQAYLEHIERHGLDPLKLNELGKRAGGESVSGEPGVRWLSERGELAHDLWHVLAGYGADQLGEAALLAFSLAQVGGRANALLTAGASAQVVRSVGLRWLPYAWKAWRRGRRAVCLSAFPYEALLALPLDEVRALAAIESPDRAHPRGVFRDSPIDKQEDRVA